MNASIREAGLFPVVKVLPTIALVAIIGCSRVSKEASTQTIRLRQTEKEISEELQQQGWELTKQGVMWSGRFTGSELTDEMVARLGDFQRFASLDLSNQKVTKEHIRLISQLDSLMQLDLSGTDVTDTDLDTLNACPSLMQIDLTDTRVTPAAADAWVAARKTNNEIAFFAHNPTVKTGKPEK